MQEMTLNDVGQAMKKEARNTRGRKMLVDKELWIEIAELLIRTDRDLAKIEEFLTEEIKKPDGGNEYVDENQTISESGKEEAWQRIQCYIDCHNYDWTFERIKNDYQKYYINGSQISYSLLDIITHNEMECKLLFENQN